MDLALAVVAVIGMTLVLADCSGGTSVKPVEAKKAVVGIVDQSTEALGPGWDVATGPHLDNCFGGDEGITYIFAKSRSAGDPSKDLATIEQLWEKSGITTQRYESGEDDPILGIRGVGGPTTSIDFNADPRGYTINAVSECADGDLAQLIDEE